MAATTLTASERDALENTAITAMQSGSTITFVHAFQGKGSTIDAHCGVTLFIEQASNRAAVVLTEKPSNPGRSLTSAIEQIASEIYNEYLVSSVPPGRVAWIEHYEKGLPVSRPTFERVLLGHEYNVGRVGFYARDWKRLHG